MHFIIEGAVFWLAWSILDGGSVVPLFIQETTGSVALVGLAATFRNAGFLLAQTIFGFFVSRVTRPDVVMYRVSFWTRAVMLLMVPALMMGMWGWNAALLFVFLYTFFFFTDGIVGFNWTEVLARTVPSRERGVIAGYQQLIGGALGFIASFLIGRLLRSGLEPSLRYAIIFFANALVLVVDIYFIKKIKLDPSRPAVLRERVVLKGYPAHLRKVWRKDARIRWLIVGRLFHNVCITAVPLTLSLGALRGLAAEQLATLVSFSVLGQMTGSIFWAQISRRLGNRAVVALSVPVNAVLAGAWVAVSLAAPSPGLFPVIGAMIFFGMSCNIAYIGYTYHMLDLAGEEDRPYYLVIQSTLLIPITFMAAIFSFVMQSLGPVPVALLLVVFSLCGFVVAYTKIGWRKEPIKAE